jgi:hypothetical protein
MTASFARPGASRRGPLRKAEVSLVCLLETGMFTTTQIKLLRKSHSVGKGVSIARELLAGNSAHTLQDRHEYRLTSINRYEMIKEFYV